MMKKILCVGECVLDIIHVCNEYPIEDSDIRSKHGRWQRGGNASNNCTVLQILGCNCDLLTTFSSADMFKFVLNDLQKRKINTRYCVTYDDCEVPLSTVLLSETSASRTIIHSNPNLPAITFNDFDKCDLGNYNWVHFEARHPDHTVKMMKKIIARNKENNPENKILISLDLEKIRPDNISLIHYADFIFLGKDFALHLGSSNKKEACYTLRDRITDNNCYAIICPWGDDGAAALNSAGEYYECAACPPSKIVDTLGAGDTFCAATIYALFNDQGLEESIKFGCKIAGAKIGFYGYDQIKDFL